MKLTAPFENFGEDSMTYYDIVDQKTSSITHKKFRIR